jgi:phospholipid N-methyltransferase
LPALAAAAGFDHVDHIVSGLPFASLPSVVTAGILDGIAAVLRPGGTFTTFQYAHGYLSPLASSFRAAMSARLGDGPVRRLVLRNLPPAYVLAWRRR